MFMGRYAYRHLCIGDHINNLQQAWETTLPNHPAPATLTPICSFNDRIKLMTNVLTEQLGPPTGHCGSCSETASLRHTCPVHHPQAPSFYSVTPQLSPTEQIRSKSKWQLWSESSSLSPQTTYASINLEIIE